MMTGIQELNTDTRRRGRAFFSKTNLSHCVCMRLVWLHATSGHGKGGRANQTILTGTMVFHFRVIPQPLGT